MLVQAMVWAIESCLCASVIIATAFAATLTMRRAAASTRHWIWSCAVVGALLSPLAIALLPKWEVGPLSGLERIASIAAPASGAADEGTQSTNAAASSAATSEFDPAWYVAFLWASGTTAILLYAFLGIMAQWRMRRSTEMPPARYQDELRLLAAIHDVRGPIGIAESNRTSTPIVSGFWNPLIILPSAASEWSPERLRVVLTHELAHIKRGDCFTQMLARLACAAYWFNPIVWIASRGLRLEQERACDDFVLVSGMKASAYASHLSGIARSTRPARMSPLSAATLAMARRSQMEGRLMAILDPTIHRVPGSGARTSGAAMILLVTITVSSLQMRSGDANAAVASSPDPARPTLGVSLISAAHDGRIDVVRHLIDQGAEIDAESDGWNALIAAAHQGQEKTVGLLLDRGADVDAAVGGRTALVAAAHQGQEETVGLLLDRGADVNAAPGGQSALEAAVHQSRMGVVKLLLERGANANAPSAVRGRRQESP